MILVMRDVEISYIKIYTSSELIYYYYVKILAYTFRFFRHSLLSGSG